MYFSPPTDQPWRLLSLSSECKQQLNTMLHNRQPPRGSLPPSSIMTPPPGANGGASAAISKLPLTSMFLRSGAICSQLQKRRHWRQAVESFLKTVEENPRVIACCTA